MKTDTFGVLMLVRYPPTPRGHARPAVGPPSASPGEPVRDHAQVGGEGLALGLARCVVAGAQDGRRVDGGQHELGQVGVERPAARLRELEALAEQRLARRGAEQEQRGRLDHVELGSQPRHAGVDLALARLLMDAALAALLELEVLDDVGDVDVGPVDADRLERLVELAAGGPDEDLAGPVLAIAGHLADHHDPGALGTVGEHRLRRGRVQVAASAVRRGLAQGLQALALGHARRGGGAGLLRAHGERRTRIERGPSGYPVRHVRGSRTARRGRRRRRAACVAVLVGRPHRPVAGARGLAAARGDRGRRRRRRVRRHGVGRRARAARRRPAPAAALGARGAADSRALAARPVGARAGAALAARRADRRGALRGHRRGPAFRGPARARRGGRLAGAERHRGGDRRRSRRPRAPRARGGGRMSLWLVSAAVLVALLVPLAAVAALGTPDDGLVALELASVLVTVALLLMAEGLGRQILGDLAVVLAVGGFAGSLAYAVLLEREP